MPVEHEKSGQSLSLRLGKIQQLPAVRKICRRCGGRSSGNVAVTGTLRRQSWYTPRPPLTTSESKWRTRLKWRSKLPCDDAVPVGARLAVRPWGNRFEIGGYHASGLAIARRPQGDAVQFVRNRIGPVGERVVSDEAGG
jgi:hypothetical protein